MKGEAVDYKKAYQKAKIKKNLKLIELMLVGVETEAKKGQYLGFIKNTKNIRAEINKILEILK